MQVTVNNILKALGKDFKWKDRGALDERGRRLFYPIPSQLNVYAQKQTGIFAVGQCRTVFVWYFQSLTFQLHIFKCRVRINRIKRYLGW